MFLIRSIEKKDLNAFFRLASILDTYNLPKDRQLLSKVIEISRKSFENILKNPHDGRFVFVAEDVESGKIVGTSEVLAKRGVPGKPFIYCDVGVDCLKSKTLKKEVTHRYIKLRSTEDGATEVGGLVVDPHFRGKGTGIGKALSYIRFMYMKAHPQRFQKRILAELLAYLDAKGENPLWNFLGKHFTGLSYHDADHLSSSNKEFILSLFPSEKIYTCLLPEKIQAILEKPGTESVPAKLLLEKIGFKYLNQVDPFDGGPLYGARTNQISLIRKTKSYVFSGICSENKKPTGLALVERKGKIRATLVHAKTEKKGFYLDQKSVELLLLKKGDHVWYYTSSR